MYRIEEAPSGNRTECSSNDKEVVKKILTHLTVDCGFTTPRLGIFESRSRPRPLRLTLEGEQHVHDALRKAKTLGNKDEFKGVRISSDRTPRQTQYFNQVRKELLDRKAK
ncbi:hypothetical protein QE152_g32052 [Popillia japonica]|uniref:Uncharacterized protein n=1 Tax=Popillia japonica TaxID=7064 RepID=A0AAW1J0R0_POPJA